MKIITAPWRVLRAVLLGLAGTVIFLEEWGWRPLTALVARLFEWPPVGRLEDRVASSPPRVALALFLVPTLLLLPVKLGALWLIEQGRRASASSSSWPPSSWALLSSGASSSWSRHS